MEYSSKFRQNTWRLPVQKLEKYLGLKPHLVFKGRIDFHIHDGYLEDSNPWYMTSHTIFAAEINFYFSLLAKLQKTNKFVNFHVDFWKNF